MDLIFLEALAMALGITLVFVSGGDLIDQIRWPQSSNRRALILIVPAFLCGIYMICLSLIVYF